MIRDPHKSAALVYCGLGVAVILITFLARLVPQGRKNAAIELGIGAIFILIFAVVIYRGVWFASALLMFSNAWRAFTYFNDGRGVHIEILGQRATQIQPQPMAFINAALMAVIVAFLAQSAWVGFRNWLASRREQTA